MILDPDYMREQKEAADNSSVRVSFVTFSSRILSNGTLALTGANPAKSHIGLPKINPSLPDNISFLGRATNSSCCKGQSHSFFLFLRNRQTFFICKDKTRKTGGRKARPHENHLYLSSLPPTEHRREDEQIWDKRWKITPWICREGFWPFLRLDEKAQEGRDGIMAGSRTPLPPAHQLLPALSVR